MHSEPSFWEGICRVHQAAEGGHGVEVIMNSCSKCSCLSMNSPSLKTICILKMFSKKDRSSGIWIWYKSGKELSFPIFNQIYGLQFLVYFEFLFIFSWEEKSPAECIRTSASWIYEGSSLSLTQTQICTDTITHTHPNTTF